MKKRILIFCFVIALIVLSGCTAINQIKRQVDKLGGVPEVEKVEPTNNSKNVAVDTKIKITFSDEMDESTLNAKGVVISYVDESLIIYLNPFLNSEYSYDQESKTLTVKPAQKFIPNQDIEVVIKDTVKNSDGKDLPTGGGSNDKDRYRFTFRTSSAEGEQTQEDAAEAVEEVSDELYTESMARNAAVDFIVNKSETYKFDARAETLEVKKIDKIGCDGCFDTIATFVSKNKGYGNRTDQGLSSGDTLHTVVIRIENGEVTEMTMDEEWDVLEQKGIE